MFRRTELRGILLVGVIIALPHQLNSQQPQFSPKKSESPSAAKPRDSKPPAPSSRIAPQDTNGRWEGTTSQGKEIVLVAHKGSIVLVKIAYSIPAKGCFSVPELNNTFQVDYFGAKSPPSIQGSRFEIIRNQTSGGDQRGPDDVSSRQFRLGRFSPGEPGVDRHIRTWADALPSRGEDDLQCKEEV
jgi:hypothetical protein